MDKGIEGIKIISLRHWLQNMGLWHHSCLSLCAQSKAFFNLVLAIYSATQTWQFEVKCSILRAAVHGQQGKELCLGSSPLPTACLAVSPAQVVIERNSENTYA